MASSLNVIALISGGKDSLFSILHCLANGHKVVALANLYPPASDDDEDLNSFMYQTVGYSVIPLYEEALGIPLYREEIRGSAVNSSREYAKEKEDETESLVPILKRIKEAHPDANAVSTGAILSTYQRTRVENVAVRLGLTPLSFLWQFPFLPPYKESSLLEDMRAVGQDARIIKVASGGLDHEFLGENVADLRTVARMKKAIGRFSKDGDGALLGEGGEFETLAVDGPSYLWRKRIEVQPEGTLQQSGNTIWKIRTAQVVDKPPDNSTGPSSLRRPPLFDDEFLKVLKSDLHIKKDVSSVSPQESSPTSLPMNKHYKRGNAFILANITGETRPGLASDPTTQLTNVLLRLEQCLQLHSTSKESITHCTLLLRNMAAFASVNQVYAQYFDFTNPPARVTVAVGDSLPKPLDVMLSVIAQDGVKRDGLHVQSQSYWAPANIGPYSQAISIPLSPSNATDAGDSQTAGSEVQIAGQIPLTPASMTLHTSSDFKGSALLSLQHLWRIGRDRGVRWYTAGIALIPFSPDRKSQEERILLVQAAWKAIHTPSPDEEEQSEDIDPWERRNFGSTYQDNITRSAIPDPDAVYCVKGDAALVPPCFVAEVEALPRFAAIEWACTGLSCSEIRFTPPTPPTSPNQFERLQISITEPAPEITSARYYTIEISDDAENWFDEVNDVLANISYATLYARCGFKRGSWGMEGVQWVPCKRVWGEGGKEVRGVLVGRVDRTVGSKEEE